MSRFFAIFGLFGPFLAPFGRDQIKNCRPENVFQNALSFTRSRSSASSSRVENSSLDRASKRDDGNNNERMTIALVLLLSQIPSLVIFKRLRVSRTLWSYSSPVTPFNVATKSTKKVNNRETRITPFFISMVWFSFF